MTSQDEHDHRRYRLIGIALMCGAVACFAVLDAMAKYLGGHMEPLQVVGIRYISAFLLALIFSNPLTRPGMLKTTRPGLQIVRALLMLATTVFNFVAFRYLQLDEALAILFSTPFLVAIMAGPLLGEWVGWRRWTAIVVGFIGVLVVIRPGFGGGMQWAALFSVAAAIFYAGYGIATRMISHTGDSSETTLFYANLIGVLVMLPVLPFVWTTPSIHARPVAASGGRRLRFRRPFPAHSRPPESAGLGAVAVHVHPARMGDRAGLPRFRPCSQPVDARRRRHHRGLGPLSDLSRAQGDRQSCPGRTRLTKYPGPA